MRPDYMGFMFLTSGVMSFNAGIWQLHRRRQKRRLMENHKNIRKPPVYELPPGDATIDEFEFLPAAFEGTFDNEGSMLVGPRALPTYKGASSNEESNGGFLVVTPFEIAHTGQFIMVNRGWVPIDAGKHRTLLMQYVGEGFTPGSVRGIFRREEYMSASLIWGPNKDNEGPVAADLSWLVMRPWNMAVHYYKRRWGPDRAEESVEKHGARHYYLEMIEDYSGDDQRMVRGHPWPWRRSVDEITYVHLPPSVHTMYIFFWFSVTLGSLYGMGKCYKRQKELFALRRQMTAQTTLLERKRQEEAKMYMEAMKEVERLKKLGTVAAPRIGSQPTEQQEQQKSDEKSPAAGEKS
ncbi:hypothetical protein, conserved [Trypanosoma brucei gambiense DAL972]|uniref:SURF1-like protein n=1 Tax=Trypanosoma brucei gambiense (strain MHOM/CI/86/DAL972) TaxID=679716 RepID=D0A6W3_TRYB9|nr:hypothetical protein, conserved [Trypanosoma brucei gambiense DAL972]CBH17414.1 hypothetical protein, conserved [Trypanosoma brucei gambiense DAL972]|eukprot:XP_011779678.1 hypothetical protein, conserved [Trypanosoma brucei gambiense DAL972]